MEQQFQTPGEYTLRTGPARPDVAPKAIIITGTLTAPFDFIEGKTIIDEDCHLLIMRDKGALQMHIGDRSAESECIINGSLKRDSVLEQFRLNSEKRWTVQEFLKFVRTMKFYFDDKAEHAKMIESLQKWSAKIEVVLHEHQTNQGNSSYQLEKKVTDVPLMNRFALCIAIFQGYPKETFSVEIGLDPKSTSVDLFLISDELYELEATKREAIIDAEVARYKEYEFSKVVVS